MAWYNSGSDAGAMTFAMANAAGAPYRTMVSVFVTHRFAGEYAVGVNWLEDNPALLSRSERRSAARPGRHRSVRPAPRLATKRVRSKTVVCR